ncbi:MAG: terminase small subunit [Vampirovibrio sp.]
MEDVTDLYGFENQAEASQLKLEGVPSSELKGFTVDALARIFACTTRNVQESAEKGVITRLSTGLYASSSVTDYIVWMRSKMTGKANPVAEDYKTRDIKATAEMKELKVAKQRGELHHERHVNKFLSTVIKTAVGRLRALPFTKAPLWFRCKSEAELCEKAIQAIDEALQEITNLDLKKEMTYDFSDDFGGNPESHDALLSEDDESIFTPFDDELE